MIHVQTDILVIGTGGAGLGAAIRVESLGVNVVVVSKAPAGFNNATIVAGSGYLAAVGGMSSDEHKDRTLNVGKGINDPELVDILAAEGGERVLELSQYGCIVTERYGGIHVGGKDTNLGQGITLPQVKYLRDRGVKFIENVIITKILEKDGRVVGAVGYSSDEEDCILFQCKALILASGGAGALYKRTDCPLKTTGDGYSLAFHLGAKLRDMEFCQFFPLALAEPSIPSLIVDGIMVREGKIINVLGEDIPSKYNVTERPYIAKSRDLLSRAMMLEIYEGGGVGGAVLLDARKIIEKADPDDFFGMGSKEFYIDTIRAHERPFRIAPISHFTMGGVVANKDGETGVPGFFVAGEVMGGVHGANRHGGNALTDVTVFSYRAANAAVDYIENIDLVELDDSAEKEIDRIENLSQRETGYTPPTVMNLLRENMWNNVGVIRSADMLVKAYRRLSDIRESSQRLLAKHGKQLLSALELQMAVDTSELIIRAAMERIESRGAHYRLDYPDEKEEWRKTVILNKKNDAIQITLAKIGEAYH